MIQRRRTSDKELISILERIAILEEKVSANVIAMQAALSAQERFAHAALEASNQAISKAEASAEKRFDAARSEADQRHASLVDKIDELSSRIDKKDGTEKGLGLGWFVLLGAISVISALFSIASQFWKH